MAGVGVDGKTIQAAWNTRVDKIIADLFQAAYAEAMLATNVLHADSPWAFCVSGSGAREEACPYSDLDCFILIDDASAARTALFLDAATRMRAMLIAMGEDGNADTLGLRFCWGGLNPIGLNNSTGPSLIGTPAMIAALMEDHRVSEHIRQGLTESRRICGHKSVHDKYLLEAEGVRGKSLSAPWSRPMLPNNKKLGLKLVQDAANWKLPDMSKPIDIKIDFYRLPQFLLGGLGAYYGITDSNSFRLVTALEQRGKLGRSSVTAFNQVIEAVARLRTSAHLGMHSEADTLGPPSGSDNRNTTKLDAKDWKTLQVCCMQLELLKRLAGQFVEAKKCTFQSDRTNPFARY